MTRFTGRLPTAQCPVMKSSAPSLLLALTGEALVSLEREVEAGRPPFVLPNANAGMHT